MDNKSQSEAKLKQQPEAPESLSETQPEPWMRGIVPGLHPVIGHLLRAAQQIREDANATLSHLSTNELWSTFRQVTSAGFHARHLAGSTDRLCSYLESRQLTAEQLAALTTEGISGNESAAALLAEIDTAFNRYEAQIRALTPEQFGEVREIGRKRYKTTAISVAIHIVEHGQRHIGGMIAAARLARSAR